MKIPEPSKRAAAARYLRACGSFAYQTLTLRSFYSSTQRALELSSEKLVADGKAEIEQLLASADGDMLRKTWEELPPDAMFQFQEAFTRFSLRHAKHSTNAACVVFAHSQLDSLLSRCCEVTYMANPTAWVANLQRQKRKIDLSEIGKKSAKKLLHDAAAAEVRQLARESLQKRLDILEAICRPKSKSALVARMHIDRNDLESLDRLRHRIVHGMHLKVSDVETNQTVTFAFRAGFYLLFLVGEACGMKRAILRSEGGLNRHFMRLLVFARREFPDLADLFEKYAEGKRHEIRLQLAQPTQ